MKTNIRKNSIFSNSEQFTPNCYAIIYCTINLINNKKYIGSRLLNGYKKLEDKYYLGSNMILKKAVIKYGIDNFKRLIIYEIQKGECIKSIEEYYLNLFDCANNKEYYNICNNYFGGNTFTCRSEKSKEETRKKLKEIAINLNSVNRIQNQKVLELNKQRCFINNPMKNKTTEEILKFNIQKKPIIIIFEKDNIELNFSSIKSAARALNFSESTVKYRYRKAKDKMINGWLIKDQ